jgi:hypothetical protein
MKPSTLHCRLLLMLAILMAGCARYHSPTIDVLGSYFPAWMVCMICGLALTLITRALFIGLKARIHPAPIVYPCLFAVFTLAVWLIFYQN